MHASRLLDQAVVVRTFGRSRFYHSHTAVAAVSSQRIRGLSWHEGRSLSQAVWRPMSTTSARTKTGTHLIMPTASDADELFQRMNARPGSIIVNDDIRLAKYNQDWTVGEIERVVHHCEYANFLSNSHDVYSPAPTFFFFVVVSPTVMISRKSIMVNQPLLFVLKRQRKYPMSCNIVTLDGLVSYHKRGIRD